MTRLSQNVEFTVGQRGLDKGLSTAEKKIDSFLQRANKLNETTAKFAQLGSIALGGGAVGAILSSPFRVAGAYTDAMASAGSRATQALADFKSGKLKNIADSGLSPTLATRLAGESDAWNVRKTRSEAAGAVFAGELSAGGGLTENYIKSFNEGKIGLAASAGAFFNNLDRGVWTANRASELASLQAMAPDDTEAIYWSAIRAREGDRGAKADLDQWTKRTWDRIREQEQSSEKKTFELLRKQLSGL